MIELIPMLVPMAWYDPIVSFGSTLMQPLYWAVSGLLVLFHFLWSPVLGADSGWTWTLSIVCLTVVIRVLLIPLFVRQIKSSRQMQLIQPKVRELQKKYGHDRQKLGEETMKLYREEGANPMASCLPLLLQSPIFFALFRVLDGAAHGIPRGQWLKDRQPLLESLQNAEIFGARISDTFMGVGFANGLTSIHVVCVILIIAMTGTMFITQLQLMRKNMPPEALTGQFAQQQKLMLYIFPLAFAFGGINFPVGVLIYWFTSNVWTMGQQFYVIRRNPSPGTPAFEAWEARRKAKGKPAQPPESSTEKSSAATNGVRRNGKSAEPATVSDEPDRPKVVRQQPRRQTRSQRKR